MTATISTTDIQLRYSGGPFNIDPTQSVGGLMSGTQLIPGTTDNLFNSSPDTQAKQNFTDYRAFYVLNTNEQAGWYNVAVSASHSTTPGTTLGIWIPLRNEVQNIILSSFASTTSGNFTLKLGNLTTSSISWSSTLNTLAGNIQNALNALAPLGDVVVTAAQAGSGATFTVTFSGPITQNKLYPLLSVPSNTLAASTGTSPISVQAVTNGTPINDVAVNVAFSNNPPVAALGKWVDMSNNPSISVGSLLPGESFFIWVERKIPAAVESYNGAVASDSFSLNISGSG
jgi:hypothetical protein